LKFQFYITEDTFTTNKQALKVGPTIMKVPFFYTINLEEGEGPFEDIPSLRKKSTIYQNLVITNPKRAQQICQAQHVSEIKNIILTDENVRVQKDFIELIEHCTKGNVTKGKVSGIHFYDKTRVKILKVLNENNFNGVIEAEIEFFNLTTKKWERKEKPTTLFPMDWTLDRLFHECLYAVNNKKEKMDSENVFVSKTESGLDVEIIIKHGLLKSIYPLV